MSAQYVISCTEKYNDVINLLKNLMDDRNSISTANKYIYLSLKTSKKVTIDVERAALARRN